MRKIAERIGRSRERVRQILVKNLGTTNHEYLSTLQLCNQSGLPRNRIVDLYLDGIITPVAKWDAGNRDYILWPPQAVKKIRIYNKNHRLCKVCNKPLPKNRIFFCSDDCRSEGQKYKYMTPEDRKRVLENIRRYRERRKYREAQPIGDMVLESPHLFNDRVNKKSHFLRWLFLFFSRWRMRMRKMALVWLMSRLL